MQSKAFDRSIKTAFLIEIFVENGHKRTFIENLVKYYNSKKKNNDSHNFTNSKKIPWVPNIGRKIRKQTEATA